MNNASRELIEAADALTHEPAAARDTAPFFRALHAYAIEWIDEVAEDLGAGDRVTWDKPLEGVDDLVSVARARMHEAMRGIVLDDKRKWALTQDGFREIVEHTLIAREVPGVGVPSALDFIVKRLEAKADSSPSPKILAALATLKDVRTKFT